MMKFKATKTGPPNCRLTLTAGAPLTRSVGWAERIPEMKILGIEGITAEQVRSEVELGAKFFFSSIVSPWSS